MLTTLLPNRLVRLLAAHGFGYVRHFEYKFPYRDGGEYPALGMLFKRIKRRSVSRPEHPSNRDALYFTRKGEG